MESEHKFVQTKEIRRENPLLSGPDVVSLEKNPEEQHSMTFRFHFDNRQYTLLQTNLGSAILVECYDFLPDELTEDQKNKFIKEKKVIDGIERDVYVLPANDFERFIITSPDEPKDHLITKRRDFQEGGFKIFLRNDNNRNGLTGIIRRHTSFEEKKAQEIANRIFDAELSGNEELKQKNVGLLDRKSFDRMREDIMQHFEMPNPEHISLERLAEILENKRVLFYTGAGISADGGVHDMGDLKKLLQIDQSQLYDGFLMMAVEDPEKVVDLWNEFTHVALNNNPTPAHIALAELAKKLQCKIFTENVDHLHEKTGIQPLKPTGDWLRENIQKEWLKDVDIIVTVGLSSDDRAFLAWYKENNPAGKIVAINLQQPKYIGDEDFLLIGNVQEVLPLLEREIEKQNA